eukprot:1345673-Amorphochlora_amoeboformis.AAC.1
MYSARRNTNLYVISLAISACSLAIGAFALYSAGAGSRDLAVPAARAPITMRAASPWAPVSMSRDMASRWADKRLNSCRFSCGLILARGFRDRRGDEMK